MGKLKNQGKPLKIQGKTQYFNSSTIKTQAKNKKKLEKKPQGFGKLIWSSLRKQVQIRTLVYLYQDKIVDSCGAPPAFVALTTSFISFDKM